MVSAAPRSRFANLFLKGRVRPLRTTDLTETTLTPMCRQTHHDYVIEAGEKRIDWLRVCSWLSSSYWSPGITLQQVRRAASNSALVLAAFTPQEQVGYLRVISDKTRFAYICDVWVDAAHRRRGLARALVRSAIDHPEFSTVVWLLATADAHAVYAPLGFSPLKEPGRWMGYNPHTAPG